MERQMISKTGTYLVRRTSVLLIIRIIVLEIFFLLIHFTARVGLSFFIGDIMFFNFISLYFILLSSIQIINLYYLLTTILIWVNEYYIINPKEIIIRKGVLRTREVTYEIANLQSMTIEQGIFQRILNYGTIRLYNPVLKNEVYIMDIPDPYRYAGIIQQSDPETITFLKRKN